MLWCSVLVCAVLPRAGLCLTVLAHNVLLLMQLQMQLDHLMPFVAEPHVTGPF